VVVRKGLNYTNPVRTAQETLRLRYKVQPVNAVCCETRTEHTDTLYRQNAELKQLVHIITAGQENKQLET
jgi:hypothetical protein